MSKRGRKNWRPEEDAKLREIFGDSSDQVLTAAIPGRSAGLIKQRAVKLGLSRRKKGERKLRGGGGKSRWSVKDIENLTGLIGAKASKETLVRDIGWSIKDILKEAKRMDLDVGYLEKGPMEIVVPLDLVLKVNKIRFDT